jgi:hypothetical protein
MGTFGRRNRRDPQLPSPSNFLFFPLFPDRTIGPPSIPGLLRPHIGQTLSEIRSQLPATDHKKHEQLENGRNGRQ